MYSILYTYILSCRRRTDKGKSIAVIPKLLSSSVQNCDVLNPLENITSHDHCIRALNGERRQTLEVSVLLWPLVEVFNGQAHKYPPGQRSCKLLLKSGDGEVVKAFPTLLTNVPEFYPWR